MKKTYTFLVMSNDRATTKKVVVAKSQVITWGTALAVVAIIFSSLMFDYVYLLYKDSQEKWLRSENQNLKTKLAELDFKLNNLESSFERIDLFAKKLKMITQVEDPDRELQLAIGPGVQTRRMPTFKADRSTASLEKIEEYSSVSVEEDHGEIEVRGLKDYGSLSVRLDQSIKASKLREQNLLELWQNLSDRIGLLAATPSLSPTKGWVTSKFGYRRSPFSRVSKMHHGIDIAANFGTEVVAPADGIVSYVGYDGGYGKLVSIDHGYGVVTRYGHNAKIHVKLGQRVKRGEKIASVGNTGRSTGPHLHYEVRVNGIPVNPDKYILSTP